MTRTTYTTRAKYAATALARGDSSIVLHGNSDTLLSALPEASIDLVLTSPPYCMGKQYEKSTSVDDFIEAHKLILPQVVRAVKDGGSICWQTGYHVTNNVAFPLDYAVFQIMSGIEGIKLRNRIVWTYAHGLHSTVRFSGRHEVVLWFTKGDTHKFELDAVRIPQKYPGKRHYKGPLKGKYSGNPLGKNPGDVWDIPNVKGNHIEKTKHPCQFPVALAQRLIKGLTAESDVVLDPFLGSGSTGVAAALEGRRFIGCELDDRFAPVAKSRINDSLNGKARFRPLDQPIHVPKPSDAVAIAPAHFITERRANG